MVAATTTASAYPGITVPTTVTPNQGLSSSRKGLLRAHWLRQLCVQYFGIMLLPYSLHELNGLISVFALATGTFHL